MPRIYRAIKRDLWERSKGRCEYCGIAMRHRTHLPVSNKFTVDHVVPECAGGTSEFSNLKAACLKCNNLKGHKSLDYFLEILHKKD